MCRRTDTLIWGEVAQAFMCRESFLHKHTEVWRRAGSESLPVSMGCNLVT